MQIEVLVHLKTGSGRVIPAGAKFSDEDENGIPKSLLKEAELGRPTVRVIESEPKKQEAAPAPKEPAAEEPKADAEAEPVKEPVKKAAPKKAKPKLKKK